MLSSHWQSFTSGASRRASRAYRLTFFASDSIRWWYSCARRLRIRLLSGWESSWFRRVSSYSQKRSPGSSSSISIRFSIRFSFSSAPRSKSSSMLTPKMPASTGSAVTSGMAALFSHLETACGLTFVLSASCSWVSPALCRSCLIFCPSSISFGSPFRTRFVFGSDAMMIPRDGAGCNNVSFMSPQLPVERQPMVERQPAAGRERSEKTGKKPVFPVARRGRCVL